MYGSSLIQSSTDIVETTKQNIAQEEPQESSHANIVSNFDNIPSNFSDE